ncbi:MAG: hypothetical protein OXC84_07570 [Gammaproteobacteria bacterium]|nr:hypothetical protein [Gammaproteobacteria bacterium]
MAVEYIATLIGGLVAVAVDVGRGKLADFPRHLPALGGPVTEAGPVPV